MIFESFQEFAARQNCRFITDNKPSMRTGDNVSRHFFENGALSDGYTHFDPSPDALECLRMQKRYWEVRLKLVETDFKAMQSALLGNGSLFNWPEHVYGPATNDPVTDLKKIQQAVFQARAELERIENELPDRRNAEAFEKEQRRREDQRRHEAAELRSQIVGVSI